MNENSDRMDPSSQPAALKRLAEQLSALDAGEESILPEDMDMLSLIVSGTLNGENIARRYPAFYQKLLENTTLRQAFLDALESVEAERGGELIPMPEPAKASPDFLKRPSPAPAMDHIEKNTWRITWQRTLEQLQAIFSPPEMAYRSGNGEVEDPWFTLLRDEMTAEGVTYNVLLDCTLSSEKEGSLSTFLNLAVTLGSPTETVNFPLRASLQWGAYQESVLLTEEGRARFPDVPLAVIFDSSTAQIQAGLGLTLEAAS